MNQDCWTEMGARREHDIHSAEFCSELIRGVETTP